MLFSVKTVSKSKALLLILSKKESDTTFSYFLLQTDIQAKNLVHNQTCPELVFLDFFHPLWQSLPFNLKAKLYDMPGVFMGQECVCVKVKMVAVSQLKPHPFSFLPHADKHTKGQDFNYVTIATFFYTPPPNATSTIIS